MVSETIRFSQNEHEIISVAIEAVLSAKAQVAQQESNMKLILNTITKLRGIDTKNNNYTLDRDPETTLYMLVEEPSTVVDQGESHDDSVEDYSI